MLINKITMVSLLLATTVSVISPPYAAMAQNQPIPYAQCVSNVFGSSGIAARVKWFKASDVNFTPPDARGDNADTPDVDESLGQLRVGFAKPIQERVIVVGQKDCVGGIKGITPASIAIVSVVGGKYATEALKLAINAAAAGVGLLSCPITAGAGCAAAAAIASGAANAAAGLTTLGVPDAKQVFYIGFPGTLELKGTVFNPQAVDRTLGVASMPYDVNIDFCISGLKDTNTGNKISVDFMGANGLIGRQTLNGSGSGCEVKAAMSTPEIVTSVRISTDGGDAMLIDQVRVYRDSQLLIWDGRDNGGGYCLSTDANDQIGGWESASSGCRQSYSFRNPA